MSTFLRFPREIRDKIIELVLLLPRNTPRPSEWKKENRMTVQDRWYSDSAQATDHVYFERRPVVNPVLSILLVNRQVHQETKAMLERIKDTPSYRIDIMYLKDWTVWPTWLSVPRLANDIDTVYAQFRVFEAPEHLATEVPTGGGRRSRGMHSIGTGGPPAAVWLFYHVLVGFLRHGPLIPKAKTDAEPITVRSLVLDFLSPEEAGLLPLGPYVDKYRRREVEPGVPEIRDYYAPNALEAARGSVDEKTLPALYLVIYIKGLVKYLLGLVHRWTLHGRILYETIGAIEIRIDGRPKWQFDLAERLSRHSGDSYASSERGKHEQFKQWKQDTVERRERAGLPTSLL